MSDFTDFLAMTAIEDAHEEMSDSNSRHSSRRGRKSWAEQYEEAKKEKGWKALILVLLFVLDCSGVI